MGWRLISGGFAAAVCCFALASCGASKPYRPRAEIMDGKPAPAVLRPTRRADEVPKRGSQTEWWYASAIDAVTRRAVSIGVYSEPYPAIVNSFYGDRGRLVDWRALSEVTDARHAGVSMIGASLRFDRRSSTWVLDEQAKGYAVHLVFSMVRAGLTMRRSFRVGDEVARWSVPVATARADGWIVEPDGRRTAVLGWRGYIEHVWGRFTLFSRNFVGWDWVTMHEPSGASWVVLAVTLYDGRRVPLMQRVGTGRVFACRPHLSTGRMIATNEPGVGVPGEVVARCGRVAVRFRVTRAHVFPMIGGMMSESIGRSARAGSAGMIEHYVVRPAS